MYIFNAKNYFTENWPLCDSWKSSNLRSRITRENGTIFTAQQSCTLNLQYWRSYSQPKKLHEHCQEMQIFICKSSKFHIWCNDIFSATSNLLISRNLNLHWAERTRLDELSKELLEFHGMSEKFLTPPSFGISCWPLLSLLLLHNGLKTISMEYSLVHAAVF